MVCSEYYASSNDINNINDFLCEVHKGWLFYAIMVSLGTVVMIVKKNFEGIPHKDRKGLPPYSIVWLLSIASVFTWKGPSKHEMSS